MNAWMHVVQRGTLLIVTGSAGQHLHVVMNDPVFDPTLGYDAVLVVGMCSVVPHAAVDHSCILRPGCGVDFVRHDTYMDYQHAGILRAYPLEVDAQNGAVPVLDPVPAHVFHAIRNGLFISPFSANNRKIMRFCRHHQI